MGQLSSGTSAVGKGVVRLFRPTGVVWRNIGGFVRQEPVGAVSAAVLIGFVVVAIFAELIAPHDPRASNAALVFASPGSKSWLGGDELGRDVFSRLVFGTRVSLYVGVVSVAVGITGGCMLGVVSSYFGGKVDLLAQRFVDALMAFPALILALAIVSVLGPSVNNVVIALSIVFIPNAARTVRSQVLSIKETEYVLASKAIGATDWRIILRHVVPNTVPIYIVLATISVGFAIVVEASLSFLGVGIPPDTPSWGGMLSGAAQKYVDSAPWLGVFPGVAIAVVVFAANLMGDALRDTLDPRLRGTR